MLRVVAAREDGKRMNEIPDCIRLFGDESCDVAAWCNRCGPIGMYGHYRSGEHKKTFSVSEVNEFFNAILEHCKTHE